MVAFFLKETERITAVILSQSSFKDEFTCVNFSGINELLFCAIFKIWKQNLPLKWAISDVFIYPMFAYCVDTKTTFVHVPEREIFFSLNCSKFAVECDWNSKNSQNVQNLSLFGKIHGFFRKKL